MTQQEYFDLRAKRYNQCLAVLPNARAMDVLPYLHILAHQEKLPKTVCDTFGGSGFITNSLSEKLSAKFTIADASVGMMDEYNGKDISLMQVNPDFSNFTGKYDLIISHGGLHHAIVMDKHNKVLRTASNDLQATIVRRLANSINPGGLLIISDIPNVAPFEINYWSLDCDAMNKLMRESYRSNINFMLNEFGVKNISQFNDCLHQHMDLSSKPAPKYFFDEYVAKNMALGHVASYPDFDKLNSVVTNTGLRLVFRMNFCTPWIFNNPIDAGWFLREKFSIGTPTERPGERPMEDEMMAKEVASYLGMKLFRGKTLTNWGVTYSAWQR